MKEPRAKPPASAVTFHAPDDLIDKLDELAAREMITRAALLRRLAAKGIEESRAA